LRKIDPGQALTILANIGVIAGIVFLGFELRQNNELMQFDAEYLYFQNRIFPQVAMLEEGGLAETLAKVDKNAALDDVQRAQIGAYYGRMYRSFEWEHAQSQKGFFEIVTLKRWAQIIRENQYSREEWDWYSENVASPEFLEFLDQNVLGP
jgi:hypothetical protein